MILHEERRAILDEERRTLKGCYSVCYTSCFIGYVTRINKNITDYSEANISADIHLF